MARHLCQKVLATLGLASSVLVLTGCPGPELSALLHDTRIQRGLDIAPVTLDMKGKNRLLVGLGSYIVNAQAGCNDCHTRPAYAEGGDPFNGDTEQVNAANYLSGGRQFGPFTSRNLTPGAESGLPADMTLTEFVAIMRHGVDDAEEHPQISPLLQVMPWPVYSHMTDTDLRAIYEYLRAIPSLPNNPNPGP